MPGKNRPSKKTKPSKTNRTLERQNGGTVYVKRGGKAVAVPPSRKN